MVSWRIDFWVYITKKTVKKAITMNKTARFAIFWFVAFFILNTFIGPLVGINDVEITPVYVTGNFFIWGAAALTLYFIMKHKQKKSDENEKMG
jgi:hypothetical protein